MFIRILSLAFRLQQLFIKQNDTLKGTSRHIGIVEDAKINKPLSGSYILNLLCLFPLSLAQAQIQTDGSMGSSQSLSGPDYLINEVLGQRAGSNLFHSFSEFNVHEGESATFTGASDIINVISRITGGSLSKIDGLLKSEIANANLYLINPAGILFGPNASLSMDGSFHVSTADFIRLGAADVFYSEPLQGDILSTAAPSAFGFFGAPKGGITLDGGILKMNDGEVISLIGGDVSLKNNSRVIATSGQVNLVGLQSQGEAHIGVNQHYPDDPDVSEFSARGNILVDNSAVNVRPLEDGNPAGRIFLRGNHLTLNNNGELRARNVKLGEGTGSGPGGSVDANLSGDVFILEESSIETSGVGNLGQISVSAENITIDGKSTSKDLPTGIIATQFGEGTMENDNNLVITANQTFTIINGGFVDVTTIGTGDGGNVTVYAKNLIIDGQDVNGVPIRFTGIFSETRSPGNGGSLNINTEELFQIKNGGFVSSSTLGEGNGGKIAIQAKNLTIDRGGIVRSATIPNLEIAVSSEVAGDGGELNIHVEELLDINGGIIDTSTFSAGDAGKVTIQAKNVSINGQDSGVAGITSFAFRDAKGNGGNINITVQETLEVLFDGIIDVSTFGFGNAGTAIVEAKNVIIDDQGSNFFTGIFSDTNGPGRGGSLFVKGNDSLQIMNGGEISVSSMGINDAGTIDITGGSLYLSDSQISSSSFLTDSNAGVQVVGNAGEISINIDGYMHIEGGIDGNNTASISAFSETSNAGNVRIFAGGDITVVNTSLSISAGQLNFDTNDLDNFQQPELLLAAGDSILIQNSRLLTSAGVLGSERGAGGDIYLQTPNDIWLENSILLAQAGYVGGNVSIDPIRYIVISSDVIAQADVQGGNYNVTVTAPSGWIQSADSLINLSGEQSGSVFSNVSPFDLGTELSDLNLDFINVEDWVSQPCKFQPGGVGSSFVVTGWKGVSNKTDDFLPNEPILLKDYNLSETELMDEEFLRKVIFPEVDDECEDCP